VAAVRRDLPTVDADGDGRVTREQFLAWVGRGIEQVQLEEQLAAGGPW
jgi:hypothetical protein